jgi:tRNA-dihydrouridine synthase
MQEVNDIAFRLLCKQAGSGINYSPMIHPQTRQKFYLDDKPILQLFCTTTKGIKEFVKKYNSKVSGWDFNLGCPAKTAKKHGFGVFLHHDLETIEKILKTIRQNTKKFFSVKLRKSKHAMKIVKIANKYCDAIAIHPRTQPQGYGGEPDLKFALKIKRATPLPVIYSGNVDETNYKEYLEDFDYLMIGRRAIGDPNIFSKFQGKETKIEFKDYLNLAIKYKIPFRQIKFQAMNFTKRKDNAKELRLKIFKAKTGQDLEKLGI